MWHKQINLWIKILPKKGDYILSIWVKPWARFQPVCVMFCQFRRAHDGRGLAKQKKPPTYSTWQLLTVTSLTCLTKHFSQLQSASWPLTILVLYLQQTEKQSLKMPSRERNDGNLNIIPCSTPASTRVFFMEQWWGFVHKITNTSHMPQENVNRMKLKQFVQQGWEKPLKHILRITFNKQEPTARMRMEELLGWRGPYQKHVT